MHVAPSGRSAVPLPFFRLLLLAIPFSFLVTTSGCGGSEEANLPPVTDAAVTKRLTGPRDVLAAAPEKTQRGGTYNIWGSSYPRSLNRWVDNNSTSAEILDLQFESLVAMDSVKEEPVGILAESWEVSADKKVYTFHIRPEARWSDGKPVTAQDFVFYYDTIMNPRNLTTVARVSLSRFERPAAPDDHTLVVRAKEPHWLNFWDAASWTALPAHVLEGKDFNRVDSFPVVSGPYEMLENKVNRYVLLRRRADWWGRALPFNDGKYNFDYIRFRFMEDREKALEVFKKGMFDAYAIYTAKIWATQTDFDQIKNHWIVKQLIRNQEPRGFQGFAINLRRERFQDQRVRRALALLLNRQVMNEKLMHNQYVLLNSYVPDLYPGYVNPAVPVPEYRPDQARALLAQAGYTVNAKGQLEKGGQVLKISFLTSMTDLRHLNLYVEDLKKVGIDASIEQLSYSSIRDRLNNFDYDLYWISWGSGRLKDLEGMWHSKQADQKASSNLAGVKDKEVDRLLDAMKVEYDPGRRLALLKQLDLRLVELQPYILLWQSEATRLLYWNRFAYPAKPLGEYGREDAIPVYWWYDPSRSKRLEDAMKAGTALPEEPSEVR